MLKKLNNTVMREASKNKFLLLGGLSFLFLSITEPLLAQRDSTGRGVDILSSFRPSIRPSAKIEFSPGAVSPDTTRPALSYQVPNQQIPLAYSINSLRPLAYTVDSVIPFVSNPFLKVGYGNLKTPFLQGSYTWGDGYSKGAQVTAHHISSRGKLLHQRYSSTRASLGGFKRWEPASIRGEGKIAVAIDQMNKYGYHFADPVPVVAPIDDSVKQRFLSLLGQAAISSLTPTAFGVTYAANLEASYFKDKMGNSETGFRLQAPLQKYLGDAWRVDLILSTDLSTLSLTENSSITNTIASLSPTIRHWNQQFSVQAGLRPTWDQQGFQLYPVLNASLQSADKKWMLEVGWEGHLEKTTYRSLAAVNPWLWAPGKLLNTSVDEKFLGVKTNLATHFYFHVRGGYATIKNMPLFINDSSSLGDGKSFEVVYEERLRRMQLRTEFGYQVAERLQAGASLIVNQFTGLRSQPYAWGILPLEFNANIRVNVLKDLLVKADLFAWRGARFREKDGGDRRLSGAFDFNAGMEFNLTHSIRLWAQFNNLFNAAYQRWNQYPVYGFNCTAGVVFSPSKKSKD